MGFWKIWIIGFAITIVTSILIHKKAKIHKFFVDTLVVADIVIVGGIAEGWAIAHFFIATYAANDASRLSILDAVGLCLVTSILIWLVGAPVLGIFKKNQFRTLEIGTFILVFIIASFCWAQPFINYFNNFEEINEIVVVDEKEHQLLYFCNIPVQQVSGSISGDVSGSVLWVDGEISGSISTSEELPYWYLNGNGDGQYNSASTNNSKIRFIEESEKNYVEVITYRKQTRKVNHNNGEETTVTKSEWKEYIFYLPQAIMKYPLE